MKTVLRNDKVPWKAIFLIYFSDIIFWYFVEVHVPQSSRFEKNF